MRYENVLLIFKQNHAAARKTALEIAEWLEKRNRQCQLAESGSHWAPENRASLVIVLGGDGTILGVARKLAGTGIPVIGINFGRVGFLTCLEAANWQKGLEMALSGELPLRSCLALAWKVTRKGAAVASGVAINDVVVARGCLARLTTLAISINGERMGVLRSDGVIFTSPPGSSGYAVSAGGPALAPELDVIGLTPICPFMSSVSPLVLPGTTRFEVCELESSGDCYLTVDGQEGQPLAKGDAVLVEGWPDAVQFLGGGASFLEKLKSRAFALLQATSSKNQDFSCQHMKQ